MFVLSHLGKPSIKHGLGIGKERDELEVLVTSLYRLLAVERFTESPALDPNTPTPGLHLFRTPDLQVVASSHGRNKIRTTVAAATMA